MLAAALAAVVIVTFARVELVASLDDQGYFGKYLILADQWRSGDVPVERFSDVSLGYLWTVTVLRRGLDPIGIRTLQIILTSFAAIFCGIAAWRLSGMAAAILATSIVLSSRAIFVNASDIEPETMILCAVAAFVAFFPLRDFHRWQTFTSGFFAGAATLFRPTFILPFALVMVWIALFAPAEGRIRRRASLLLLIGAFIPLFAGFAIRLTNAGVGVSMNPGTVLYEGMNPFATGYGGIQPRIVNDLEETIRQPDSLHISYRIVASRALGEPATPEMTNRYWIEKAVNFATDHPGRAAGLFVSKIVYSLHGHESWDLVTMVRKDRELEWLPWISFGLVIPLAVVGLASLPAKTGFPFALLAIGQIIVMAIFYVSARQRNGVWVVATILAGCGLARIARWVHRRRLVHLSVAAVVLVVSSSLLIPRWHPQREDQYSWTAAIASSRLNRLASAAHEAGDLAGAEQLLALDHLWLDDRDGDLTASSSIIRALALKQLRDVRSPQRSFDLSLALIDSGDLEPADRILEVLSAENYDPRRGNFLPRSISWQRARIALLRDTPESAIGLLRSSVREAPGTPEPIAALRLLEGEETGSLSNELERWLDPFTADLAIMQALALIGRHEEAGRIRRHLAQTVPEWQRPRHDR